MIQVPVRSIWHGQVGINEERYVKPALANGQGLSILHIITGEVMEILPEQVQADQVGRSELPWRDKFGGSDYYLVYYKWVPTAKQGVLI